jgi:hypothetical protein
MDLCFSNSVISLPDGDSNELKHETVLIRIHSVVKQYANQLCHVKTHIAEVTIFFYRLSNSL